MVLTKIMFKFLLLRWEQEGFDVWRESVSGMSSILRLNIFHWAGSNNALVYRKIVQNWYDELAQPRGRRCDD